MVVLLVFTFERLSDDPHRPSAARHGSTPVAIRRLPLHRAERFADTSLERTLIVPVALQKPSPDILPNAS